MILPWTALFLLITQQVHAVELKSLAIEYRKYIGTTIMAEMPDWKAKEGLAVDFDSELYGPTYWNNKIHATTDDGQYRLVGWEFELGVTPLKSLDLFYNHHSQHILDGHHPYEKFAGVNNSVGLRWRIFDRKDYGP